MVWFENARTTRLQIPETYGSRLVTRGQSASVGRPFHDADRRLMALQHRTAINQPPPNVVPGEAPASRRTQIGASQCQQVLRHLEVVCRDSLLGLANPVSRNQPTSLHHCLADLLVHPAQDQEPQKACQDGEY